MSAVTGLTVWAVLLLGVAATGTGTLSRVPLAVLTLTALAAFEAVSALPAAAVQLGQARVAAGRIAAVIDAPDPVVEPHRPRALPSGPFGIQLRDATVVYRPGGPPALDRISLDLPPGRRVALVGANGAGKSTVAAVLTRFCELTAGTAKLNGHDLASYAADDVRSVVGGCPQNPYLFDATIRDNLRLARPDATDEELAAAAARARLLPWITSLPQGWDTQVGRHGAAVSGGERQRLALARAFLADPPLLILDEPTAHLDPPTRRALAADLLRATAGRAVLLITHELDGLDQMDEIVVLDHGAVAEQGRHEQLRHAGGPYQRLWDTTGTLLSPIWNQELKLDTMTTGADRRLRIPRQARSRTVKASKATADTRDAPSLAADLGQLPLDAKYSVPQPRAGTVGHGDLVDTARSSDCRLVAVTAPAGYGKSTFLAQWAATEDRPVAWASLDPFDDDPATLLASLASAYCRAGLGSPDLVVGMRGRAVSWPRRAAPRLAAELRASPVPYVIMLDDLHEVRSPACHEVLGMVVSAIPPGSQLAAASRDEPPELPRLRATADALEIGAGDLALDATCARQIFANAQVRVTTEQAAAVTERTEGWPAGLYLAALIARQDPGQPQAVSGEDRYVADYLYREALAGQPKMIQRFLRRTAVLDQLSGPLCEAVLRTPAADIQLRQIEAHSLFLAPLDRERRWYRYHGLFREFLLGELHRAEPGIVTTLRERAADWYEANGLPERAVEHLLQTADRDRATRLVTRLARPAFMAGRLSTVQRWYREIGDADIERHPPLAVLRCWEKALTGDIAEAPRWAALVDAASFDGVPEDGAASFDSARAMLRAGLCADGPEAMLADAAFAVAREPALSPYRDTALWLLAQAHLLTGHLDEARDVFGQASATAVEMGNFDTIPSAEAQLAWLAMDRGAWQEAASHVNLALATVEDSRLHDYVCSIQAFGAAARLSLHHGDRKAADRQLASAMRSRPAATYLMPYLAVRARLQLAKVYFAIADAATARQLLREIDDIVIHRPALGTLTAEAGGVPPRP